ncbi:MAG: invasion associated locus B family protein [Rubrimonas sp.]
MQRISFAAAVAAVLTVAVPASAQQGEELVRTQFGDWTKLCTQDNAMCVIEQIGRTAAGEDALSFQIEKLPQPQDVNGQRVEAVANIRVPLGVVLTQGLRLQIDQGEVTASPFFMCQQVGCLVRAPLQPQLVDQLKRGARATMGYTVLQNGEPAEISVNISLTGFTRAIDSL